MGALLEALLGSILEPLLAVLGYLLLWILVYLLAVPFFCLVLTPVVLVSAAFGPGDYWEKVWSGYRGVCLGLASMGPPVW